MLRPTMMQHGPGLAASPPVRNNLEVGRRGILFLRFSAVGGQSLYEAAVRVLLFEQRRPLGSHSLVERQTLPQTTAPNHCYGYRCTIPRRSGSGATLCGRFRYSDLKEAALSGAADLWVLNRLEVFLVGSGPEFWVCREDLRHVFMAGYELRNVVEACRQTKTRAVKVSPPLANVCPIVRITRSKGRPSIRPSRSSWRQSWFAFLKLQGRNATH